MPPRSNPTENDQAVRGGTGASGGSRREIADVSETIGSSRMCD